MEQIDLKPFLEPFIKGLVRLTVKEFLDTRPQPDIRQIDIIDGKELMTRLAISEPTLIRWRKRGKVPFMEIGSSIRYDWFKVLEALEKKGGKHG
ncbi:MAG TPA: helix-turn-helix domain-containing protein [Cyclobacteriaceae bacterium]|nr:helix-turn-helix domain-containing protein [Cyclobacteriaceae bacterium]